MTHFERRCMLAINFLKARITASTAYWRNHANSMELRRAAAYNALRDRRTLIQLQHYVNQFGARYDFKRPFRCN